MKKLAFIFLVLFGVVLPFHYIGFAEVKENTLEVRQITESRKSWTISFSDEVNEGSVKKENIQILNERKQLVKSDLAIDKKKTSITISPEFPYKEGKKYYLVIKSNLKSIHNIFLPEKTIVPFVYDKNGSAAIGEVKSTDKGSASKLTAKVAKHQHFSEITVTVSEEVVKVKAGRDDLEYKGNNQFLLYKPGLESGDKITIKGYSISGKVIESKEVIIP